MEKESEDGLEVCAARQVQQDNGELRCFEEFLSWSDYLAHFTRATVTAVPQGPKCSFFSISTAKMVSKRNHKVHYSNFNRPVEIFSWMLVDHLLGIQSKCT